MRTLAGVVVVFGLLVVVSAQEKPVPSDSLRVTLTGCARKSLFVVRWRQDHEPTAVEIAEGRQFRLTGRKDVLNEVKAREGSMVELTGLIRKNAVSQPQGISVGGVRVGIGPPQQGISDPARTPQSYQPILDVESYQLLPEPCSTR